MKCILTHVKLGYKRKPLAVSMDHCILTLVCNFMYFKNLQTERALLAWDVLHICGICSIILKTHRINYKDYFMFSLLLLTKKIHI